MPETKSPIADPYENLLIEILTEVSDLREQIEVNADKRLKKYQEYFPE